MAAESLSSGHPSLNAHGDVLNATPDTPEAKERLVVELKTRGNAAFKAGQLPVAEMLYSKAIEHDSTIAALYGNRSMVREKMGKFEEALEDGDKAVETDPSWSKAYFRRGKALMGSKRFAEAYKAFEKASDLEPKNKDLKKEMDDAAKAADKKAKEDAEESAKPTKQEKKPKTVTAGSTTTSKPAAKKSDKAVVVDGDESEMKGYKILADGRKTSFFHHEMTPEERALLGYGKDGNLAPKSISPEEAAKMEAEQAAKAGESSVWAGNTWEDRKLDGWAQEKLEMLMKDCSFEIPEKPGAVMTVVKIADPKSTASIYVKLGKKRYLFDLNFTVEYAVTGLSEKTVEGQIKFVDVLPDDIADEEVMGQHKFTGDTPSGEAHSLASKYASKPQAGLQALVISHLSTFSKEFHAL